MYEMNITSNPIHNYVTNIAINFHILKHIFFSALAKLKVLIYFKISFLKFSDSNNAKYIINNYKFLEYKSLVNKTCL